MDLEKEKLLTETHQKFMETGLNSPEILTSLDEITDLDIMGFGTTVDERIFSLADLKNLLIRQKEQSKGIQISWTLKPVFRKVLNDENAAVIVDDVFIHITIDRDTLKMSLRYTNVLEYRANKWVVIHFHGSKPENVASEEDTWGIEQWKKRNAELEKLVQERTTELERSLDTIKSTQAQLILAEKMASLGELTAGIAHEIQNPLNFVNNFSEVSTELVDELSEELSNVRINADATPAITLVTDLKTNLEKITYHGKRASEIVKSMLQHSRTGSGQKETTDINQLTDEYLRLAYHGLKAKEKDFNVKMETHYDQTIGQLNLVAQDIGRVILNLINNAFYAVMEKKKSTGEFSPNITITTKNMGESIKIMVTDNGSGIPTQIAEKIFQPFYTTKPAGQGTGLGLSLSYDIVKAHGGNLMVESTGPEGTTFVLTLPVT